MPCLSNSVPDIRYLPVRRYSEYEAARRLRGTNESWATEDGAAGIS
jgi:hypothetical protein